MGVIVAMFAILALGGFGIYFGLKTLENYRPGRKKIQKDLAKIRSEMQPYLTDLVPVDREEMEQLSFNQIQRSSSKGIIKTHKGIFTTIYHEPVVAWSYRGYVSGKENALVYARTSSHEFIYRINKGSVEIVVDDLLLGVLDEAGNLYSRTEKKALAQINRSSEELALPVIVNEKEVGSLANPKMISGTNPRAFYSLSTMNKEEEKVFLSLSILEMVKESVSVSQ